MSHAKLYRCFIALSLLLPIPALAQTAFTTQAVNVRAGPDRAFPLVTWLRPGTPVNVIGCINGWRWCDVVAGGWRGWVYSRYLSGPIRGRAPVITFSVGSYWGAHYRGRPWYSSQPGWNNWGSPGFRPPPPPRPRPPAARPPPLQPPVAQPPMIRPPGRPPEGPPNFGPPPPDSGPARAATGRRADDRLQVNRPPGGGRHAQRRSSSIRSNGSQRNGTCRCRIRGVGHQHVEQQRRQWPCPRPNMTRLKITSRSLNPWFASTDSNATGGSG